MSDRKDLPVDFAEWIERSLEGTITPEQWRQLDHEVAVNETACDFYWHYLAIHMGLVYKEGVLPQPQEWIQGEIQKGMEEIAVSQPDSIASLPFEASASDEERQGQIAAYARQKLEAYLAENQSVPPQVIEPRWDMTSFLTGILNRIRWVVGFGRRVTRVAVYAGIVGLVVLIVGHQIMVRQVVARVTDSVCADWSDPLDEPLLRRGWLILERGLARIEFRKGAQVILAGPCEFKLQSNNRMFLVRGSATVTVPKSAIGFAVETPSSLVVDFGTEFGISADADRGAEVHVFQGRVGVGGKRGTRQRDLHTVEEGLAAQLGQDGSFRTDALRERPQRFIRDLPSGPLVGNPLLQKLIVYYGFDEADGATTVTDLSGHGLVADIMGPNVVLERPGMVGRAVEAGGDGRSFIAIDDHPGNGRLDRLPALMDLDGSFTLSCWIGFPRPPRYDGTFGSNYVMGSLDLNNDGRDRRGLCFVRKPRLAGVTEDDFIRGYDDVGFQGYGLSRSQEGDLWDNDACDGFHHYVLVCNENGNVDWYRDNVLRRSVPFAGPITGTFGGEDAWIFGGNAEPTRAFPERAVFDEFAVWDRTLTTLEIAHLYYRGRAGVPLNALDGSD